jgi:hypothetical protein
VKLNIITVWVHTQLSHKQLPKDGASVAVGSFKLQTMIISNTECIFLALGMAVNPTQKVNLNWYGVPKLADAFVGTCSLPDCTW